MQNDVPFYNKNIAEIVDKLIETVENIIKEAPNARNMEELSDVFLQGDRKIYTGILLGIFALILVVLSG